MQMGNVEDEDKTTVATDMPKPPNGMPKPVRKRHHNVEELEGEKISDRYLVLRRVGKGGMGVVYLAQQTNLNRDVCIKVLNPALIDDESAVVRFEREARGLSRLQHPNIVTIFDYGRDDDLAYIVMEYAQGETLSKFIKREGAMHMDVFLPIAVQILKGIGAAHKLGLIHRDIKPANIMLCELEGQPNFVKILDFGLAKLAQGQEDVTKEQQLVGSASYMAPEQILQGVSDARTDVYALGIMFYQMLAGKKPFTGPNDNIILYKHVNEQPAPLKSVLDHSQAVPDALCQVIEQALNKDPEKRPQSAIAFLDAISYSLEAPQLRMSFSSMSIGRIDLHQMSEEGETHNISSDSRPGVLGTETGDASHPTGNSRPIGYAPLTDQPHDMSGVTGPSNVRFMQGGTLVQPTNDIDSLAKQKKNNSRFVGIVVGGAVLIAILVVAVISMKATSSSHDKGPQLSITSVEDEEGSSPEEYFAQIESNIFENKLVQAEQLLETFNKDPNRPHNLETEKRIIELRTRIDCEKDNLRADKLLEDEQREKAKTVYNQVLEKDPTNKHALDSLEKIKAQLASIAVVDFLYEPSEGLTFYMDGVEQNFAPNKLELKPGTYKFKVTADGYSDYVKEMTLAGGDSLELKIALEKKNAPTPRSGTAGKSSKQSDGLSNSGMLDTNRSKSGTPGKKKKNNGLLGL